MYFLDEVALDLLKNLINFCGQKLHSKKLIFSPIHECKNLKAFKDIILPFFKNLSYLLSQIFVDEIYIDLAPEELQFLVENFPLEEMSFIKDKNVHLYMKNGGLSYELSKDCLAKMVYGYQIGFRNSMEMDLSRISNEDFCEIFLKAFKETNNIEAMPKLINLDGSMKFTDKNFVKFLNNYTGITGRIEGLDELGWEHVLDEIGLEHVYELKRPDFWTLTIEFKLEKIWQGTKLVCEECSKLYTDKKSFAKDFGRSGTWYREDFPIRETISWREHKLREKDRKKSRYWRWDDGLYKWLHYRKDGILELKSFHDYEKMEEYVLKKASFKIFFDSEAYNRSQAKN
uniref:Uncharacterized protein n=1 Tax=Acrobeloides nanus TaxID=290746 RepID=A0A914EDU4_9BILA